MPNTFINFRQWSLFAITLTVVLVPSYQDVDYKFYAASIGFFILAMVELVALYKKSEIYYSRLDFFLALYIGWTCLSCVWSPVDLAASEYLGRILPCVGFYFLFRQVPKASNERFILALALGILLLTLYGFLQKAGIGFMELEGEKGILNRIFSSFGNPNPFAAFLILTGPMVLLSHWGLPKISIENLLKLVLGFLIFGNICLTESRAGMLACLLQFFTAILFLNQQKLISANWKKWLAFISLFILLSGGLMAYQNGYRPTERLEVWKGALQMIKQKPIEGWGIGQFSLQFSPYVSKELSTRLLKDNTFTEHAHNELLETIVELGLVGFSLAGLFWITLIKRAWIKLIDIQKPNINVQLPLLGLLLGLLGVGLTNLFDYNCRIPGVAVFIWVSAALLSNLVYPPDKIKLPNLSAKFLAFVLILGLGIGLVQDSRLLYSVLTENSQKDFLKDLPQNLPEEEQKVLSDLKSNPNNAADFHRLGNVEVKQGKMDEARQAFEMELKINPNSAGAFLNLGNIYFLGAGGNPNNLLKAKDCYQKNIEIDPQSLDGHFNLAYIYFVEKDLNAALKEVDQVLKIDPQNAKALELKREILP